MRKSASARSLCAVFSKSIFTHLNLLLLNESLPVGSLCKVARNHNCYRECAQKQYWAQIYQALRELERFSDGWEQEQNEENVMYLRI